MLVAVVPQEQAFILGDQADSGLNYVYYIQKVTTGMNTNENTYRLPSSRSLGFRTPSFSLAKNNSHAAISNE